MLKRHNLIIYTDCLVPRAKKAFAYLGIEAAGKSLTHF